MSIFMTILTGAIASLIASVVFAFSLFRYKPSLEISDFIADQSDKDGRFFTFKIINRTKSPVINIRADATVANKVPSGAGYVYWTRQIPLVKDYMFQIGGFDRADTNADFALRFVTKEDVDLLWQNPEDFIRLRVIATHPFSNFSRVFVKEFRVKSASVVLGAHQYGEALGIVKREAAIAAGS
jgi:hypothetical protein